MTDAERNAEEGAAATTDDNKHSKGASNDTAPAAPSASTAKTDDTPKEKPEYNQKWFGYLCIMLTSLINWSAISSVPNNQRRQNWRMAIAFGVMSFVVCGLVLFQDRTQKFLSYLHYSKARDGYLEGYVLLFMVIWWIVGVGYITSPGGIAYVASNIYYSAWFSLFSCIYTLNDWSKEKDILTIEEITGVSYTLKSWWVHFFAACVVFGSFVQLYIELGNADFEDTSFGIALGLVSMVLSMFYILMHYDFFSTCGLEEGGWLELSSAFFLVLVWVIGLSILTQDGGIGATMEGNQCYRDQTFSYQLENCTLVIYQQDSAGTIVRYELECADVPRQIPGSNVFFASWFCMLSAIHVAFRWKAAQAIKFAQAKQEQEQKRIEIDDSGSDYGDDDDDGL